MKVSIVTISFNQVEFLQRAIDSVLSQDYPDIEYIIVDPGSNDGSRDVIESYRSQFAFVILEPDQGPADGLNRGFALSSGEILGFLNADDVLAPRAVSAAASFFLSHPDVDVVSGHADIIGPHDEVVRRAYSDRMNAVYYIYGGVQIVQPSTFFRRTAFQRVSGFNANNRLSWDGELFLEMALAGCKFALSDEIWSGYRLHPGTITTSSSLDRERKNIEAEFFRRVLQRDMRGTDRLLSQLARLRKHLLNPRDSVERILNGPIAGRQIL
jgi:glycosyltransferase involved in cell wall biosynthesis